MKKVLSKDPTANCLVLCWARKGSGMIHGQRLEIGANIVTKMAIISGDLVDVLYWEKEKVCCLCFSPSGMKATTRSSDGRMSIIFDADSKTNIIKPAGKGGDRIEVFEDSLLTVPVVRTSMGTAAPSIERHRFNTPGGVRMLFFEYPNMEKLRKLHRDVSFGTQSRAVRLRRKQKAKLERKARKAEQTKMFN